MEAAVTRVAAIFASPHEPGAAAILPQNVAIAAGLDMTATFIVVIRLEGIALSVEDRAAHLREMGGALGTVAQTTSEKLWAAIRDVDLLAKAPGDIWKLSCAPASAPAIVEVLEQAFDITFYADWAGGLMWFAAPSGVEFGTALRAALTVKGGGYAHLLCDRSMSKDQVPVFQPLPHAQANLTARVKAAFDPLGVLNFGRMHNGI